NNIYIKGEVSNCKYHSSGHIYFTLKDGSSAISCVMFAGARMTGLTFRLTDGQSVVAGGNVSVYERDGKYQLYAKEIFLHGAGALYEEYERLKQKLYEEGLFDMERKKPIEKFPKKIGIVTASTGAAIRDIESIAKRRNPYVQLVLYPAKVQGIGASESIVRGIKRLDQMNMDTIIIGRGGGSIEDLWAFNEEIVARAIFRAKTPIISGTGHETDTTIADYVADLRAPTPSAACELAIPDIRGIFEQFHSYEEALKSPILRKVERYRHQLERMEWKLEQNSPSHRLQEQKMRLADLELQLEESMKRKIERTKNRLALYTERLNGLSPTAKLARGYGYVTDQEEKTVTSVTDVQKGEEIKVTLLDGTIHAVVKNTTRKE
ncbi:MAG TPA: exodeoxyribonuclease VII large subunit, partial [Candidatus Scybalomonas excrementigallinarum]|nr:exodeoxyribonuclease VII large subunit [Candidatus Scybalomonas excrementigallinarum]